jgi:hypothetical protein
VACLAVNYFSTLSHKRHDFRGKKILNKIYIELLVPTNALRQFLHCFLYYKDATIRISAVILPTSGGILSEFLHRPVLWLRHNSESVFVTTSYKICIISGIVKLLKVIKFFKF